MADANGENAAKEIQKFFAVRIVDIMVFGMIDDQRLVVISGDTRKRYFFCLSMISCFFKAHPALYLSIDIPNMISPVDRPVSRLQSTFVTG